MAIYAIGDIQGCLDPLKRLLDSIQFDSQNDQLWFTGDLINRGPHSLETLRFIKQLSPSVTTVLGNHDITLLAVAVGGIPFDPKHHTFADILKAPDRDELINWLHQQPLLYYDPAVNALMTHAGIYPQWDLLTAQSLANECEKAFQNDDLTTLLPKLYGNYPNQWSPDLKGIDRIRFITNVFTRMRGCSISGELEFTSKGPPNELPNRYLPWFEVPREKALGCDLLFGHWASLKGECNQPHIYALDTGCVWGNTLTALRLKDKKRFTVPA